MLQELVQAGNVDKAQAFKTGRLARFVSPYWRHPGESTLFDIRLHCHPTSRLITCIACVAHLQHMNTRLYSTRQHSPRPRWCGWCMNGCLSCWYAAPAHHLCSPSCVSCVNVCCSNVCATQDAEDASGETPLFNAGKCCYSCHSSTAVCTEIALCCAL